MSIENVCMHQFIVSCNNLYDQIRESGSILLRNWIFLLILILNWLKPSMMGSGHVIIGIRVYVNVLSVLFYFEYIHNRSVAQVYLLQKIQ